MTQDITSHSTAEVTPTGSHTCHLAPPTSTFGALDTEWKLTRRPQHETVRHSREATSHTAGRAQLPCPRAPTAPWTLGPRGAQPENQSGGRIQGHPCEFAYVPISTCFHDVMRDGLDTAARPWATRTQGRGTDDITRNPQPHPGNSSQPTRSSLSPGDTTEPLPHSQTVLAP